MYGEKSSATQSVRGRFGMRFNLVGKQFPRLKRLYRLVFSVVASAVDVESIWSKQDDAHRHLVSCGLDANRAGKQSFVALFEAEKSVLEKAGCPLPL